MNNVLINYNKYLLNYRYFSRVYLHKKKNINICLFYLKSIKNNKSIVQINKDIYFSFFFSKFLLYYYYTILFFKYFFSLQRNYFILKNYFFSKMSYRYHFFELFWTLFKIVPIHWSKLVLKLNIVKVGGKKKRHFKWFSYLFNVSSGIDTFFNIQKENSFLILAKRVILTKVNKTFKSFNYKIRRFKREIIYDFIKKLRKIPIRKLQWRRFAWFYKLKRKKKYIKTPKRLKYLYVGDCRLKKIRFKYLKYKDYKKKRKFKIFKLLKLKFAEKSYNLLQKKTHYKLDLRLSLNFGILRKVLTFLSSSSFSQSITKVHIPYSLFSNFRLIYTIFSDGNFIKNLLYVNRFKRYQVLFNYLKSRFLKKNINKSLYSFMFNSNVIYYFFIPKVCRHLLLKIYIKKRLLGFSWIFFTQLNNLFSSLFSSNLFFNLNFTVSESLNRSYLNNMFSEFLQFNPPKSKYHFLKELCDIYLLTGITKDSNLLHAWIIKNLSIIFFRRHWQFLGFLKMTLMYIFKLLKQSFGIKGIFITFRGKIGQVGSVRKKAYFLRQGVHTLSNLSLKASFNSSITKTDTGAIGVSVYLFY